MARKPVARRQIVLAALLLVSLVMLTAYYRESDDGSLHALQRSGLRLIAPVESGVSRILDPFKGGYEWVTGLFSARSENVRLQDELNSLRTEVVSLREASAENQRLKEMLDFLDQPSFPQDYTVVAARVIGRSGSPWNATITINRGLSDGIVMGQTVVSGQGLVGQISAVTTNSAQVLLIVDQNSHVEGRLQGSAAQGTIVGSINGQLEMDFVEKNQSVTKKDVVVTSGTGRLFVKGVPIGVIDEVSDQEIEYFKSISVTPFVEFGTLEEVMVLVAASGGAPVVPEE